MTVIRFILAALTAGIVNLVVGIGFAHTLGVERLQAQLVSHGLRAIGQPSDVLPHVLVRLLTGAAVTLLFVCVTPRFPAGPKAALVAGLFAWAFVPLFTAWGHAHIGLFPASWSWALAGFGIIEMMATALAGGWVVTGRRFWR
jgi:hypothetical protein